MGILEQRTSIQIKKPKSITARSNVNLVGEPGAFTTHRGETLSFFEILKELKAVLKLKPSREARSKYRRDWWPRMEHGVNTDGDGKGEGQWSNDQGAEFKIRIRRAGTLRRTRCGVRRAEWGRRRYSHSLAAVLPDGRCAKMRGIY